MPLIQDITKPSLILSEEKCRRNIRFMAEKAENHELIFRPHFKTHQSLQVGKWFRKEGVERICVSSVDMAAAFSDQWQHILIAFPVNIREIGNINNLAGHLDLSLLIESAETAKFLMENLENNCSFYIKIDTGYHRTGIDAADIHSIRKILDMTKEHEMLNFEGFLVHNGHTYYASSLEEINAIHIDSVQKLTGLKKEFIDAYPNLIISIGDTPSCSVGTDFRGVDEIRPGNFVFYDVMQAEVGSCSYDDIAVAVACPVVAKHKERNEMVIYGGAIHLSKESIPYKNAQPNYGLVAEFDGRNWGLPLQNTYIKKLSQEHGIIKTTDEYFDRIRIGQLVAILPIHSCLTVDALQANYSLII